MTSVPRTLLDLGAVVPEEVVELALDSALRRRLTTIPRLRHRMQSSTSSGRKGVRILRRLLDNRKDSDVLGESPLETKMMRLIECSDLPRPVRQHEVFDDDRLVARFDFAYPHAALAIETDGYQYHHGRARWERDLRRRSDLARLGWRVMHFGVEDLRQGEAVVAAIREALFPSL